MEGSAGKADKELYVQLSICNPGGNAGSECSEFLSHCNVFKPDESKGNEFKPASVQTNLPKPPGSVGKPDKGLPEHSRSVMFSDRVRVLNLLLVHHKMCRVDGKAGKALNLL